MDRRQIHRWRSRSQGRRRKLSRAYRFGRRDWLLFAGLAGTTIAAGVIFSLRAAEQQRAFAGYAMISQNRLSAASMINQSRIEITLVADNGNRFLIVRLTDRSGKPWAVSARAIGFSPPGT